MASMSDGQGHGPRVVCPACGCNLQPVPGVPLGPVRCPDCGKRIDLRRHAAAEESPVDEVPAVDVPVRPAARRPQAGRWVWPVVAGGVTAAVVAGVTIIRPVAWRSPALPSTEAEPWDRAHGGELLAAKTAADGLALRGELRAAYDAYNRVLSTAADHGVTDPVAFQVVAAARAAQDRVFAEMVSGRPAGATVAASVPVRATGSVVPTPGLSSVLRSAPFSSVPADVPSTTRPADVAQSAVVAADLAPPVAHPPPPPRLHTYTLPDALGDDRVGEAIDEGITYLRGQFRNGEIVTGLNDMAAARPPPPPADDAPAGLESDGDGGTSLDPPVDRSRKATGGVAPVRRGGGPAYTSPWAAAYSTPGIDALAVYALLHAAQASHQPGLKAGDPTVEQVIARLKSYALNYTYHRSLRAAALAVYARPQDLAALEDDTHWLVRASRDGAYTYTAQWRGPVATSWDNSNSQYGLLGVWSGAQSGVDVGRDYWRAVDDHWTRSADPRGGWGYSGPGGSLTMTCAGIASLLVARDHLDDAGLLSTTADRPTPNPVADAGLARLDEGDNYVNGLFHPDANEAMGGAGYGLYGLERVGLASGFKYFGSHDWYAELARLLVAEQHADGSWGGSAPAAGLAGANAFGHGSLAQRQIDTAYALLTLARGRHPILYNKLRYPGNWNDRPHDVAHLAKFATHRLERPMNWQVVNLRRDWFDWLDAPVLYVSGDRPPKLTDHDYAALRDYALGGGTIFTHADGGSPAFDAWVKQAVRRLFPKYELITVAKDHPLNTVLYRLTDPPPLQVVTNGSRVLLVHSPTDLAGGWHLDWTDAKAAEFQAGLNVFVHAAGKTDYKNRLSSTYIPAVPNEADRVQPVARLRYAGEWDPEPYAWTRFARYFQWETHAGLDVKTIDLKSLKPGDVPVAFLTGTVRQDFTAAEAAATRAFVEAGGVVVVDACGGQAAFDKSVRTTLLPAAFPGAALTTVGPDHPLLVPTRPYADDLRSRLPLRPFAAEQLGTPTVPLQCLRVGRGWVIVSRLDLTSGLLGTESWGIVGYDPAYAMAVVKNAVLWAAARDGVGESPAAKP